MIKVTFSGEMISLLYHCIADEKMDVTPSCSDESSPTDEDKRKAQEIIDAIRNDPEAICDGEVNRYLTEPVMIRDSTSKELPQVTCAFNKRQHSSRRRTAHLPTVLVSVATTRCQYHGW